MMITLLNNITVASVTVFFISLVLLAVSRKIAGRIGYGFRKVLWILLVVYMLIPLRLPVKHFKFFEQLSDKVSFVHMNTLNVFIRENNLSILCVWLIGILISSRIKNDRDKLILSVMKDSSQKVADQRILNSVQRIKDSMNIKAPIRIKYCERVQSPVIAGMINPVIYIPDGLTIEDKEKLKDFENILKHELYHYKSGDILYKKMIELAVKILWFNPVIYFIKSKAYEDMELVCDAKVTRNMELKEVRRYCNSILNMVPVSEAAILSFRSSKDRLRSRIDNCFDSRSYKGSKRVGILSVIAMMLITVVTNTLIYGRNGDRFAGTHHDKNESIHYPDAITISNSAKDQSSGEKAVAGKNAVSKVISGIDKTSENIPITHKAVHYDTGLKISNENSVRIREAFLEGLTKEEREFVEDNIFAVHGTLECYLIFDNHREQIQGESTVWKEFYDDPDDGWSKEYYLEDMQRDIENMINIVQNDSFRQYLSDIENQLIQAVDEKNLEKLYIVHQEFHDLSYFTINYPLKTMEVPPPDWHGIYVYFGTLDKFCE